MGWAGKIACMGQMRNATKFWSENLKGRNYSQDKGIDERKILKWILEKQEGKVWTGCIWLRIGTSGRLL
jgi:hypothetical protein